MPTPLAVALAAAACALVAALLTPWARRLVDASSRWLHRGVPAALGALGGAGAVLASAHPAEAAGLCALAVACALLVPVDLATERLPDALVLTALAALLVGLAAAAALTGDWGRLGTAVLASLAAGAGFLVLAFLSPSSLGLGDVKLALPLGLALGWHGWTAMLLGLAAGFVLLALAAIVLLATRRTTRGGQLPFGPWMVLGAAIVLGVAAAG
ncbi:MULTISPECIES: prepilin peptidase [unclassified Agrococcus]|uniref:prepilin peptidase n=1 Tax=unclassified Agrococcus TaxID=2615065 RepID=UPI00361392BB